MKNQNCNKCEVRNDIAKMCGNAIINGLCGVCRCEVIASRVAANKAKSNVGHETVVFQKPVEWSPEIAEAMRLI